MSCELGVSCGVFTKVHVQRMTNGLLRSWERRRSQAFPLETTPVPVLLHSLEVCNLSERDVQSLDFTVNRFFLCN